MNKRLLILLLLFYYTAAFSQQVTRAEYFFNSDPGIGLATTVNFTPADSINVTTAVPIPASLQKGLNFLYLRVANNTGAWSEPEVFMIVVSTAPMQINKAEYFFNTDPGMGNANPLTYTTTDSLSQVMPIPIPGSLPVGLNKLYIRVQNTGSAWSEPEVYSFIISNSQSQINSGEYFWDTDPGFGNGTSFSFSSTDSLTRVQNITIPALPNGAHRIFTRTKNSSGTWSMPEVTMIVVGSGTITPINSGEYYWDTDPGFGNGTPFNYTATDSIIRIENITVPALSSGPHKLYSRVKNIDRTWSMPEFLDITVCSESIIAHPNSQTVCTGSNVTFSVSASGSGLTYQWRRNGANINGATSSSYTINGVVIADAGDYDVVVTGSCGSITSNTATLTVNAATVITTQPSAQTVCTGSNVTFNVTATGTGTLTYQWRKNGANINGATSSSYTINGVVAGDAGNYDVIVTGTCGSVTSSVAGLTIYQQTAIITQPANQTACLGGNVTFSVTAAGNNLTYQWQKNSVNINGATSSSYTINGVVAGDAGTYTVVVTGTCGVVTSSGATLSISSNTVINTQPASQSVCSGSSVTFSVSASGSGTITYQWKKNGANIPGATSSSYTINPVIPADAGNYTVDVTSNCGTTTSNIATLTVLQVTSITTQPISQSVCPGGNITFSVVANGVNLTYQWRKNGVNISGATATSYSITGVVTGDAGNYDVIVTGTCGTVTSALAILTVHATTVITTQPTSQTVCSGSAVTFSVTATGTALIYQWRKNGVNISGATAASYSITVVVAGDAGNYDVIVTGTCGTVTSASAILTVNATTVITIQPVSQAVCPGSTVTFNVTASGTALTYQWRKNGVNISGATTTSYSIVGVVAGDAGNYDVVVTGTCGTVTSSLAILTININTSINTQPSNQSACLGASVTFTVSASGSGTLSYQWKKNGVDISGATASTYIIASVTAGDAANYSVAVTGTCGTVISNNASLSIISTTVINTQPASQSACIGSNVTFTVVANGNNLTYQWRKNGVNIGGAVSASYTINNITSGDAANYDAVISGTCGTATSAIAFLAIIPSPAITNQPISQTVFVGTNVLFTVTATGSGLTYQWRKGGMNIPGANVSSYTINNVSVPDAGNYDVVVGGTCLPAVISATAVLTVNSVTIITQPVSASVCVGSNINFNVVAAGVNLSYQWQVSAGGSSFTNILGATNSTLSLNSVPITFNGNQYRCEINGILNSNAATLTVNSLPVVTLSLPFDTLYLNSSLQTLSGGLPTGGVYSMPGVTGGSFLPSALGLGNYSTLYQYTDNNGCTASSTDLFTIIPKADKVNIYPVPAKDGNVSFVISSDMLGSRVTVYQANGQKVADWVINSRLTSYQFKWSAGVYIAEFRKGNIKISKQFIIGR